ncbi:MAG: asparagine synthase-related protein, partial [Thermoanaerobaculia bacterium]
RMTARFPPDLLFRSAGDGAATPRTEYLRAFREAPGGAARRAMFADLRTYLADDSLVKLDRATMSVGLEGRVPLLDHRVVRFVLSLPLDWLWRNGRTKAPLRPILHRRVPPALVDRPKSGFGFPVFGLLAGELRRWTTKYLDGARLAEEGLLDPDGVRQLVDGFDSTDPLSTKGLWYLVCFERWFARVHRGERGD